ncbi:MAG: hypothetical protein ACREQB_01820 [Candidatus Binataceae bacterium]
MERMTGWGPDGVQIQREASWLAFALTGIVTAALLTVAALHHDLADGGFLADRNLPVRVTRRATAIAVVGAREAGAAEQTPVTLADGAKTSRFAAEVGATASPSALQVVVDAGDGNLSAEQRAATLAQRLASMGERDLARLAMLVALIHPAQQRSH